MNFKEYIGLILEKSKDTSRSIFSKIMNHYIPITPKAMERIFTVNKEEFFHVTDIINIEKVEKLQGSKKTMSCFTDFGSYDIFDGADGIDYDSPITFVLKGSYTFGASEDIYTEMDEQGRRWVMPPDIRDGHVKDLFDDISEDIFMEFMKSPNFKGMTEQNIQTLVEEQHLIEGKDKARIIKDYLDASEKIIKKYKKDIEDVMGGEVHNYNEVLGYNFKIVKKKMLLDKFLNFMIEASPAEVKSLLKIKTLPERGEYDDWTLGNDWDLPEKEWARLKTKIYTMAKEANIEIFEIIEDLTDSL